MPSYFRIIQERSIRVLELTLPPGIDASEFDRLNQRALAEVEAAAAEGWVIDLAPCQYVGSAGLGFLINVRQRINAAGGTIVLCELSPTIAAVMRTSSLGRLFHVAPTRETAVEMVLAWQGRRGGGSGGGRGKGRGGGR